MHSTLCAAAAFQHATAYAGTALVACLAYPARGYRSALLSWSTLDCSTGCNASLRAGTLPSVSCTWLDIGDIQPLWETLGGELGDLARITLSPGQSEVRNAFFWPGTTGVIYRDIDTLPLELGRFTLPGDHLRLQFTGHDADVVLEIGPTVHGLPMTAVRGAGVPITADHVGPGPVEVWIDPS